MTNKKVHQKMREALLIGINHYKDNPLKSSINDVMDLKKLLSTHYDGSPNFKCTTLISDEKKVLRERRMRSALRKLFKNEKLETALFYFSGHGISNDYGGYLVPQNSRTDKEGVAFFEVLALANSSSIKNIIIILDCCYSGRMGNMTSIGKDKAFLREGISILTSSHIHEKSLAEENESIFTGILKDGLEGRAANLLGEVNISALYGYTEKLLGPLDQRPIFKAYLPEIITLRKAKPKVQQSELVKIKSIFDHPKLPFPLDPSYEINHQDQRFEKNEENISTMNTLRIFRAAGLVEPIGEKYLYDAAVKSKSCKLTPKGRFYWTMAIKGKLD